MHMQSGEEQGDRERKSKTDSGLRAEPNAGLNLVAEMRT